MIKLLDFYADWCGPCKMMAPIFEQLSREYKGKIEFESIDVESNENMASQYDIRSIPTFVLLVDGKEQDRKIGAMPKEMVKTWLDTYLK